MKLIELIEAAAGIDFKVVYHDRTDNTYVTKANNIKGYMYLVNNSNHFTSNIQNAFDNNQPVFVVETSGELSVALPETNEYFAITLGRKTNYDELVYEKPEIADIIKPVAKQPQQQTGSNPLLNNRLFQTIGEKIYIVPTVDYMTGDLVLYARQLAGGEASGGSSLDEDVESTLRDISSRDETCFIIYKGITHWLYAPTVDDQHIINLGGGDVRDFNVVVSKAGQQKIQEVL
jgi:hypothetical protein